MSVPDRATAGRLAWAAFAVVAWFIGHGAVAHAADTPIGGTTIGGKLFLDTTHLNQYKNGKRTDVSRDGADLTRFYIDIDHRFSEVWSAHLTTDINWLRDDSPTDLWVKRAYLQGAFGRELTLRLGVADLPWTPFVNSWSGYRYIDKELVSRLKYGGSVDWGVHLLGAVGERGQLQYATALVSGSSYKRPRTGDSPDVEGRVAWQPNQYTVLAVGAYDGKRALDGGVHVTWHRARRWDAMAAYADQRFRFGGQYFRAIDWNEVRLVRGDRASGWSVWGSMKFGPHWALFARHDQADTSERIDPTRHERYDNLGLEWDISRQLRVAAAYKHERITHPDSTLSAFNELGLWAQIGF
jgi:hypothetical protein